MAIAVCDRLRLIAYAEDIRAPGAAVWEQGEKFLIRHCYLGEHSTTA